MLWLGGRNEQQEAMETAYIRVIFFYPQTVTSKECAFPLYGHILSSKTDAFPHVLLEWLLVQVCEQVVALLEVTEDSVC